MRKSVVPIFTVLQKCMKRRFFGAPCSGCGSYEQIAIFTSNPQDALQFQSPILQRVKPTNA